MTISLGLLERLDTAVAARFSTHPFESGISKQNAEPLLGNYLAMSQAFPYLQAGSQAALIDRCIKENLDVPREVELTSVVGNFLAWDETGGYAVLLAEGAAGLKHILETDRNFHSNLLRRDIRQILGRDVAPDYSTVTREYLEDLYAGLSDWDPLRRLAYMLAFERHAGSMIGSLWRSLSREFAIEPHQLHYFYGHVGGTDPAEQYHIEMTRTLAMKALGNADSRMLIPNVLTAYARSIAWCEQIKLLPSY